VRRGKLKAALAALPVDLEYESREGREGCEGIGEIREFFLRSGHGLRATLSARVARQCYKCSSVRGMLDNIFLPVVNWHILFAWLHANLKNI
jgi:hypothetical protein